MEIIDMMRLRKITPSNISPWEGTPVEGSPYTAEQQHVMRTERPHWTRFNARRFVLKVKPTGGFWSEPPKPLTIACPIIAWTKDRARVLVVTPAGFKQWVPATPNI